MFQRYRNLRHLRTFFHFPCVVETENHIFKNEIPVLVLLIQVGNRYVEQGMLYRTVYFQLRLRSVAVQDIRRQYVVRSERNADNAIPVFVRNLEY